MDPFSEAFNCPIPAETVSDVVPMIVVFGGFMLLGYLIRRRRRKAAAKKSNQ